VLNTVSASTLSASRYRYRSIAFMPLILQAQAISCDDGAVFVSVVRDEHRVAHTSAYNAEVARASRTRLKTPSFAVVSCFFARCCT
jgi:hypothetical protein